MKGFEIVPVKPNFTHTLEPARPVQGRVTEKASGKPLAGMLVEMIPMRRHGGMPFSGRTDADGRYKISGHRPMGRISRRLSACGSGYLDAELAPWLARRCKAPRGQLRAGERTAGFRAGRRPGLRSSRSTGRPVSTRSPNNPNNNGRTTTFGTRSYRQGGRFAITGPARKGRLAVEAHRRRTTSDRR